ncbi:MAG: hypothetical protein EAZ55_13925 [Cytophagales bacterium]|nr:MAG: hypothetical protein EAZ55_13925 [Cytophagales bacterium]
MQLSSRNLHRDIAYFYLGLIISFALSGIFLNHRQLWHPQRYISTVEKMTLKSTMPKAEEINEAFIQEFAKKEGIQDRFRRFRIEKDVLKISYVNTDVEVNLKTGEAKKETYKTTPILGQMTKLHLDTSQWWIYYSDIFGIAMLVIAITGMFIAKGKYSFAARGWKLALLGVIFPLIFLFLLS